MEAGDFEESIKVLERYIDLNDSIQDDELSQEIIHEKYMTEAKQDSLSFAKEKELSDLLYEKKISDDKMLLEIENLVVKLRYACMKSTRHIHAWNPVRISKISKVLRFPPKFFR